MLEQCSGTISRRDFLKSSGLLVVSVGAAARRRSVRSRCASAQAAAGPYPDPDFRQLDSWIVIHEDNTATFYVGKTDCGQGTGTAFRQMMSDELDIAYDKTTCIMGSTDVTVDQGGSGGSDAIQTDGWPMRRVAAEARRVLLEMASARFGVPVDQLAVSDGVITVKADPSKTRHLRRTDRRKAVQRRADGQQHRCDHRRGEGQAGAGPQDRRPVAAALRHSCQGGRLVEVGRGREAARHGACAQREAAGGRREADQHRRVVRAQPPRIHQGREQGQLRGRRLRAGRAGDQCGQTAQGQLGEAGDRAVPVVGRPLHIHARRDADVERKRRPWSATPTRRSRARRRSSRPNTTCRSRGTRPSVRLTPWPIRRTAR